MRYQMASLETPFVYYADLIERLLGDSAGRGPWAAETHGQHRGRQFASVLGAARRLEQEAADTIALEFWHRGLESGYQCYLDFSQRSVRRMHHFGSMGKICFKAPQQGDWVLCAGWQVRGWGVVGPARDS